MKILVAEDDNNKCDQVARHVRSLCGERGVSSEVVTRPSYRSSLKQCISSMPDILILDMTMPTFDIAIEEPGGRPRHFAGRDILRELQRRGIAIPTIVITGFDVIGEGSEQCTRAELTRQLHEQFPESFRGTVFYTTSETAWKNEMAEMLVDLLRVTNG